MTQPLTPDRLAKLRRIASGEDWSSPQQSDLIALLGWIDRLNAENAELRKRLESIRLVASALPYTVDANPDKAAAQRAVALLGTAIDRHATENARATESTIPGAAQ